MMLPSNTYTKRSALCRCGWEASPGAKSTVSTMPSFPGTSGRSLVIRRVTFPTGNASTLPNASTPLNATNRDNTSLFIFYSFQPWNCSIRNSCLELRGSLPEVHDVQKEIDALNNQFRRYIGVNDR